MTDSGTPPTALPPDAVPLDAAPPAVVPPEVATLHAAIDIGTNSFHLVVARADAEGGFDVLTTEKEMVRLGSGPSEMTRLEPEAIDRGIAALQRMSRVARSFGAVDLVAVATSAVREAQNGHEFIDRARDEAGVAVEIIAGLEEARLIHLGVLQALPVYDRRLLLVDIGGGSTEFVVGQGADVIEACSMKLGSIRLTERFFADRGMSTYTIAECRHTIGVALAAVARDLGGHQPEIAVGSSGTIATVAAMAAAARGEELRTINGATFGADELEALVELVASTEPARRKDLPGMDPRRADIISGGIVLLSEIFASFGLETMTVSGYALREGVLLDRFGGSPEAGLDRLADLRRANVVRMVRQLDPDPRHAHNCAELSGQLFDRLAPLHGLDRTDRELLICGALLHNVGLFISHSSHHKHSYYVIRNSDQLTGFTQHEIELVAQIARYHRRAKPKDRDPDFAALTPEDQRRVRILAGIVRVAVGLDRSHAGRVRSLRVVIEQDGSADGDATRPMVSIEPLARHVDDDLDLEVHAAADRAGLLADALGVAITLSCATTVLIDASS